MDDDKTLAALGDEDWRVRRRAVDRLVERRTSGGDIDHLLRVLRESHRDFSRLNGALQVLARTGADVVPALVRLLDEPDRELRCYVSLVLGERGDRRAVAPLIAMLSDSDTNVRIHAIEALGCLGSADAVDPLLAIAASHDFSVAFPALSALGLIGDARVASTLIPLLHDPLLQPAAVESLGRLGDRETIQPLVALLAQSGASVGCVAQALVRIVDRETERMGDSEGVTARIRAAIDTTGEQAIATACPGASGDELASLVRLLGLLPSAAAASVLVGLLNRPEIREAAARALKRQGSACVAPLSALLPFADADTQCTICEILREQRVPDAAALRGLLDADEPEVIVSAIETIAAVGEATVYPKLKQLFTHADKGVRHAAAMALAALRHPDTVGDFRRLLSDPSPLLREAAVKVLGRCDGVASFERLLQCMSDSDERVRRTAIEYLPTPGDDRIVRRLVHALQTDGPLVRQAALQRLAAQHFEQARPWIVESLGSADAWLRYLSLRTLLERVPDVISTESLRQFAVPAESGPVRATAITALGERREGFATLVLLTADNDPDIVQAAIAALGAGRFAGTAAVLAPLIAAGEPARRIAAIQAVAASGQSECVELLRHAIRDPNRAVSAAALAGLGAIQSSEAAAAVLEAAVDPTYRDAGIRALQAAGAAAIPPLAIPSLQSHSADVRRLAIEVLRRVPTPTAVAALRLATDDPHPAVSFAANGALAQIRPPHESVVPVSSGEGRI